MNTVISADNWLAINQLYARYAASLDSQNWQGWLDCFTDSAIYKIQPRENFEKNLPLCTLDLSGKGMLQDRIFGIQETLFHDPYYQRHIVSVPLIIEAKAGTIHCETNYLVVRTKLSQPSEVYQTGRYIDEIVATENGLKFAKKHCVYDSELILNSLIYPV